MNGIFCPPWGVYLWEKREIASRNIRPVLGTTHERTNEQTNIQKGASWGIFFKLLETYKTKHSGCTLYIVQCVVFFTLLYFVCICDEDKFSSLRCLYAGAKTVIRASSDCILRCFGFYWSYLGTAAACFIFHQDIQMSAEAEKNKWTNVECGRIITCTWYVFACHCYVEKDGFLWRFRDVDSILLKLRLADINVWNRIEVSSYTFYFIIRFQN